MSKDINACAQSGRCEFDSISILELHSKYEKNVDGSDQSCEWMENNVIAPLKKQQVLKFIRFLLVI